MNRRRWLVLLVAVQVLVLAGMAAGWYAVDLWGREIRLETRPVDPRDFLYGDYVTLSYEISEVPMDRWKGTAKELEGGQVPAYVRLTPTGDRWIVRGVYPDRPADTGDDVVIRARASDTYSGTVHLVYGLERYYVPEGTGRTWEGSRSPLIVTVKAAPWGQAKIIRLERD